MSDFTASVVARLLAESGRHCCICRRWCGQRMQIHHIQPDSQGGPGTYENGIPVCLDCHAEVESRSNMGRRFTAAELLMHRDRWFATVSERPEVLIRSAASQLETGPLEALHAELDFNRIAVGGNPKEGFPPLMDHQFRRAIATNALAALPSATRESIQRTYALIGRVNFHFTEMAAMDRSGGRSGAFAATDMERSQLRSLLVDLLPTVMRQLSDALTRTQPPRSTTSPE